MPSDVNAVVISTDPTPARQLDLLDLRAEREAQAIDAYHEMTGYPIRLPRLTVEREFVDACMERGLPIDRPHYRYQTGKAVARWIQILDALNSNQTPPRTRPYWDTQADRQRQAERRAQRRKLLARLIHRKAPATIREACALTGAAQRTIEKGLTSRELGRIKSKAGRVLIPARDLYCFLKRRVG